MRMRHSFVIILLLLITSYALYAQSTDPASLENTKSYSSEKIEVRKFDEAKWKKIVGTTNYNENQALEEQEMMEREKARKEAEAKSGKRAYRDEDGSSGSRGNNGVEAGSPIAGPIINLILQIIFYGAVIAIIGFIIYYIIKNTSFKSGLKNAKIIKPDFTEHVEDISELDVDSMLKKTLAEGNFRLAIRMYFLGLLKKLNEDGVIVWKKDKTNHDYLNELFSKAYYFEEMRRLTLAYEQVWYGDHTLPSESYHLLMAEFKAVDQKLQTSKAK